MSAIFLSRSISNSSPSVRIVKRDHIYCCRSIQSILGDAIVLRGMVLLDFHRNQDTTRLRLKHGDHVEVYNQKLDHSFWVAQLEFTD